MLLLFEHFLIVALCLIMRIVGVNDDAIGYTFVVLSMLAVVIYVLRMRGINKRIKAIILVGIIVRMALVVIDVFVSRIVDAGTDDDNFYNVSMLYYDSNYVNMGEITRGGIFPKFLSIVYFFIGSSRFSAQYLNVLFFAISSVLFVKTLVGFNATRRVSVIAMVVFCLLPNGILNNSVLRRETIMELCICSSLYFYSKWYNDKRLRYSSLVVIFTVLASLFHTAFILGAVIFIVYFALFDGKKGKVSFSINKLSKMVILLICAVIAGVGFLSLWKNKFTNISSADDLYTTVSREGGGSAYLVGYEVNSLGQLVLFSPLKLFYFLFSPVPWSFRGWMDIASFFLDVLIYAVLLFKVIRYPKDSYSKMLLGTFLIMSLIFGLGTFNSGTAIRHRLSLLPYLLVGYSIVASNCEVLRKKSVERVANEGKIIEARSSGDIIV